MNLVLFVDFAVIQAGNAGNHCVVYMTDDPVGGDFTVTAADCWVYYDNMHVPGGVTVTVETGGHLIDRL